MASCLQKARVSYRFINTRMYKMLDLITEQVDMYSRFASNSYCVSFAVLFACSLESIQGDTNSSSAECE
jgi:hypothetical protein